MPAREVMVLQEVAQHGDITEASLHRIMNASQSRSVGVTGDLECINESVVHGEVEDGVQCPGTLVL